jgi:hypothetical protein
MPLAKFSNAITLAIAQLSLPIRASPAKPKFETAIRMRLISTDFFIPSRAYRMPPTNTPTSSAMKPTNTS